MSTDMLPSAHDIAAVLREREPSMGMAKLQKLLYYAQGWHLAVTGRPMFHEVIEGWRDGPVVAAVWADETHGRRRPEPRAIPPEAEVTLDYVYRRYGRHTGRELIDMTHAEAPWKDLGVDPLAGGGDPVTPVAMKRFFRQDPEFMRFAESVQRLRSRTDIYDVGPRPTTPAASAALERALRRL